LNRKPTRKIINIYLVMFIEKDNKHERSQLKQ
jgi:hypothetical protein